MSNSLRLVWMLCSTSGRKNWWKKEKKLSLSLERHLKTPARMRWATCVGIYCNNEGTLDLCICWAASLILTSPQFLPHISGPLRGDPWCELRCHPFGGTQDGRRRLRARSVDCAESIETVFKSGSTACVVISLMDRLHIEHSLYYRCEPLVSDEGVIRNAKCWPNGQRASKSWDDQTWRLSIEGRRCRMYVLFLFCCSRDRYRCIFQRSYTPGGSVYPSLCHWNMTCTRAT